MGITARLSMNLHLAGEGLYSIFFLILFFFPSCFISEVSCELDEGRFGDNCIIGQ